MRRIACSRRCERSYRGVQSITLDAAGNLIEEGPWRYSWDAAGRLKSVSHGGTLRATYHYDHRHRRTRKVTTAAAPQGADTVVYHYDQHDRLIAETGLDGSTRITYLWRDQVVQAIVFHGPPARTVWLQHDHLGTPRRAWGQDGRLVWRWHSDAYGTTPADPDPEHTGTLTPIALRLPGQYHDPESGLHYNWHRYYSPRLARYLSPDPIGVEGGGNLFAYANSAPTMYADTTGLAPDYWWRPCNSDQVQQCRQECASQGKEYESCAVRWVANQGVRNGKPSDEAGTPSSGGLSCSCKEPQQSEQQSCGGNCQKRWKAIRDTAGIIILWTLIWVCS